MNKTRQALVLAFEKGYRIVDGELYYNGVRRGFSKNKYGYLFFTIRLSKSETWPVQLHRLVAYEKYGSSIFDNDIQVRHMDGNKQNILHSNILIGTKSQNEMDKDPAIRIRSALLATAKVRKYDHDKIISMHNSGMSYNSIMAELGIKSKGAISFIINNSMSSRKQHG